MSVKLDDPLFTCPYIKSDGVQCQAEFYILSGCDRPQSIGYQHGIPQGNCFYVVRDWLPFSDRYFDHLRNSLTWTETYAKVTIDGVDQLVKSPRLVHFTGDLEADQSRFYNYSSYANPINPWEPYCQRIRDVVRIETGLLYDTALINLYRDGKDSIGYHGDREVKGLLQSVATISLGSTRRFYMKNNATNQTIKINLNSGDLVIMTGNLQKTHMHSIPKQAGVGPRISITYRKLID